jgi:spore germination protein GerM
VYWLREDASQKIELAPNNLALKSTEPDAALRDACARLLAGPIAPTTISTIPQGTKLRSLDLKNDGVHIDLSKDFVSGGGSTSMTSRVAQVLYTATSLEPSAKVWISVEGKPLETLGGEGLLLEQPLTRTAFERDFDL